MPFEERALELLRRDREGLQEPEHVGEPQTDEPDAPLLDRAQDVVGFGRQRHAMHGTCRPRRLGYGAVTSGGRALGRVYDARRADPGGPRSNARGGARSRARPGRHLPGRATTPSRGSSSPVRRCCRSRCGSWGSRPPRPTSWSVIRRRSRRSPTSARGHAPSSTPNWPTTSRARGAEDGLRGLPSPGDAAGRGPRPGRRVVGGRRRGDLARWPRRAWRRRCRLAAGDVRHGGDRSRQARRRRAELRERRRPDLRARGRAAPRRRTQAERAAAALIRSLAEPTAEGIALRVDPTLRPGGRGGAAVAQPRGDARLLRAPVGHVGAPGDDQGAAGRRRSVDRLGVRRGRGAVRVPGGAGARMRSTTSVAPRSGWRSTSGGAARSSPR